MFSRWRHLALIVSSLVSFGCGLKIGEKAPVSKPVVIGTQGTTCFSHFSESVSGILNAEFTEPQIRSFLGCIRYSFVSFARHTRGEERDTFRPEEIRDFLHEYFIKDRIISDKLIRGFMNLKVSLIGGKIDRVSRKDITEAIDILQFLEDQTVRLNQYMSLYNFRVGRILMFRQNQPPPIEEAVQVLKDVAEKVGQRISARSKTPYSLDRFSEFVREFRNFFGWQNYFDVTKTPEDWEKVFRAYKSVASGNSSDFLEPKDWVKLLKSAATIYGISLKVRYASERQSLMYGEGLESLVSVFDDLLHAAQYMVDQQGQQVITYQQLDRLIDALEPIEMLPRVPSALNQSRMMKARSLKKISRAFFDRIFGEQQVKWTERKSDGLSRRVIQQMGLEISKWTEIQRLLDRTFGPEDKNGDAQRLQTLSERLGPLGASRVLSELITDKPLATSSPLESLRYIEGNVRPLFRRGENQIFLTETIELPKYGVVHGFHNLSMMNLIRGFVTLVGRGYSSYQGEGGPFDRGISETEMQAFYLDFRDFGVDLQLFDPKSDDAGLRSFREANLFTYSGNGIHKPNPAKPMESLMTYPEGMEVLAFIMSGGQLGRSIYSNMMNPETGLCYQSSLNAPLGVHNYKMVSRKCFRERLMETLIPQLTTMPSMQKELTSYNGYQKVAAADNFMSTIYTPGVSNSEYIDFQEIMTISVIMHYTEAVMTRYNRNGDLLLNTEEVWDAFETFKGYMESVASEYCRRAVLSLGPSEVSAANSKIAAFRRAVLAWEAKMSCNHVPEFVSTALFAHLVSEGEVPKSLLKINYLPRGPLFAEEFAVKRANLLRVFAALVKANSDTAGKK